MKLKTIYDKAIESKQESVFFQFIESSETKSKKPNKFFHIQV